MAECFFYNELLFQDGRLDNPDNISSKIFGILPEVWYFSSKLGIIIFIALKGQLILKKTTTTSMSALKGQLNNSK